MMTRSTDGMQTSNALTRAAALASVILLVSTVASIGMFIARKPLRVQASTTYDTAGQLSLPFGGNNTWGFSQGPHNWAASGPGGTTCPPIPGVDDCHPWSSLDLYGGDGVARAAREGIAHINDCNGNPGIVRIDHGDGWQTTYYHLSNVQVLENQWVNRGDPVGNTGEAVPCGGNCIPAGHCAHVHFSVWYFAHGNAFSFSDSNAVDLGGQLPSARGFGAVQIGAYAISDGTSEGSGCMTNVITNYTACPGGYINPDGTIACPPTDPAVAAAGSSGQTNQSGYFNWYGLSGATGWNADNIHAYNPGTTTAVGTINLPGSSSVGYNVGAGQEAYYAFPDPSGGGPVQIAAQSGPGLLTSQRVNFIYSHDEVNALATPGTTLYFPYYAKVGCSFQDNIHIVNPSSSSASGTVSIPGYSTNFTLGGGQEGYYGFAPGAYGGPVKISVTSGPAVLASQRVTYYSSFDEVNAMNPANADYSLFLMYYGINTDYTADWIHILNPGSSTSNGTVTVGSSTLNFSIAAGGEWHQQFASGIFGPVQIQVTSGPAVLASQRVTYRNSFSEVNALSPSLGATTLHFNWYGYNPDPNVGWTADFIHLVNLSNMTTVGTISLPGQSTVGFYMPPNGSTNYEFPSGATGGPVTVQVTSGGYILASQRVQYHNSFHEVNALELH